LDQKIKRAFSAFGFGMLQDIATAVKIMKREGVSSEEFVEYVEEQKRRHVKDSAKMKARREAEIRKLPKCPECKTPMVLRPAGEDPSEGSHWTCPKCRFGRYDARPLSQIQEELRKGVYKWQPDANTT